MAVLSPDFFKVRAGESHAGCWVCSPYICFFWGIYGPNIASLDCFSPLMNETLLLFSPPDVPDFQLQPSKTLFIFHSSSSSSLSTTSTSQRDAVSPTTAGGEQPHCHRDVRGLAASVLLGAWDPLGPCEVSSAPGCPAFVPQPPQ